MINALFVCSQNKLRSPTAEHVFAGYPGVETDSAGLGHEASVPLSSEQIHWATVIFVMEPRHKRKLSEKFRTILNGKKIVSLGIPDDYSFMQPELIELLKKKVEPFLR